MDIKLLKGLESLGPLMPTGEANGEPPVGKKNDIPQPESADIPKDGLPEVPQSQGRQPNPVGAYENYLDGVRDVETGKDKLYETNHSFEGKLELVADAVDGFVAKFVDGGRGDEIAALKRQIDELPEGRKDLPELRRQLKDLEDVSQAAVRKRKEIIQYVYLANAALKSTLRECKNLPPGERQEMLANALTQLRRDIRKFRFEYDRRFGLDSGYSWFRRRLDNFFTTSRWNHLLNDLDIDKDAALVDEFTRKADALRGALGLDRLGEGRKKTFDFGYGAKATSLELHDINNYIRGALAGNGDGGYFYSTIKSQVEEMAKNGGKKTTDCYLGVGIGFKIAKLVDLRLLGEYHHLYRISCEGNGTVTIEHLNGGEAVGRAGVGAPGVAKGSSHAEGGGRKSQGAVTFKDVDGAVRHLCSGLGFLNPQTAWGALGTHVKTLAKNAFGLGYIAKFGDFVIRKLTGSYDPNVRTDDHRFVDDLKRRRILSKMAQHILPGANTVLTKTEESSEYYGGFGANGEFQAGPARLEAAGGLSGTKHKGTVTEMKPYLSALEFDFAGEATRLVGNGLDLAKTPVILSQKDVDDVRAVVTGGQTKARDVIERLKDLCGKINAYAEEIGDKGVKADPEAVAWKFRNTALLAVALFEKWESLVGVVPPSSAEKADYEKFSGLVRKALVNPGVKLPKETFGDILQVKSDPTRVDYRLVKENVKFKYSFLNFANNGILGKTDLDDSQKWGFGKELGRIAAGGAVSGASAFTGLGENGVEAEFTERTAIGKGGRPWKARETTTIDIRTGQDSLLVDAILLPLGHYLAKKTGQPVPEGKEAALEMLINAGMTGGTALGIAALLRGWGDISAHLSGSTGSAKMAEDIVGGPSKPLIESLNLLLGKSEVTGGRNVQIVIEDGRLRSIGIGSHFKLDFRLDFGEGIVGDLGFKMDSVVNGKTYWPHPSFHSIVAKCESYCKAGNYADWAVFALQNRAALARFDKIVRAVERRRPEDLKDIDLEDGNQFKALRDEIDKADFSQLDEHHRLALEGNRIRFRETLAAIHDANGIENDLDRAQRVKTLLECVVRHYSLMDDLHPLLPSFD